MKRSHNRVSTDHVPPQFLPLRIVVLCLLAAMLAAACGGAGSGNRPSASADTHKALLAFAQCMREHGITSFPDPSADGGFSLGGPNNSVDLDPNSESMKAARTACEALLPKSTESSSAQKEHYDQALAFSKCMREHGVANFPDPQQDSSGGVGVTVGAQGNGGALDPESPTFKTAMQACQSLIPGGQKTTGTGGKP